MQMHRLPRSRAVDQVGYDADARTLRVFFRDGGHYDYFDVPKSVFDGLIEAAHPWTMWGTHIKQGYRYRRLS